MNKKALPRRNPSNPVIREYDIAVRTGGKSYHVLLKGDSWIVKKMGAGKGKAFETQDHAVRSAKNCAKRDQTDVFIHGRDGRLRERSSYAPNPRRSK